MTQTRLAVGRTNFNFPEQNRNDPGMDSAGNRDSKLRSETARLLAIFSVLIGFCAACVPPVSLSAQTLAFTGQQTVLGISVKSPRAVAMDRAGDLFYSDDSTESVMKVPAGGGPPVTVAQGFPFVNGIAVDGAGDVFVADSIENYVVKVPAGGGPQTTIPAVVGGTIGVAVDAAGDVFIAGGNNSVVKVPAGGGAQTTLVTSSNLAGGLEGIGADAAGDVFIADGSSVVEVPAGGTPFTLVSGLEAAVDIAVNGAGNVFISDSIPNMVLEYHAADSSLTTVGSGLDFPLGIAVNELDEVFVGNYDAHQLLEIQAASVNFGAANVCAGGKTTPAPCNQTLTLNYIIPSGGDIATGGAFTLGAPGLDFTLAPGGTCVGQFQSGGTCSVNVTFAPKQSGPRQGAVQITDDLGNVLVSTLVYGIGNGPQIAFSSAKQTNVGNGFNYPIGVAVDGADDVFVADSGANIVYKVPAGGGSQTTVGTGLNSPAGVAVDGAGDVFIADQGNFRVVEVPAGGGAQTTIGSNLLSPVAVAVDGAGDVFIVDLGNYTVQEVHAGGALQTTIGTGLLAPQGVAVDAAGDVFIADSGNNRVVEVLAVGGAQNTVLGGLAGPTGVAVDAAGNVFIADYGNNRVLEVDVAAGTHSTMGIGLKTPEGVAVDSAGDAFIVDTGNTRVLELPRSQAPSLSFASTILGETSSDSPQTVIVQNIGNEPLNLSGLSFPADFALDSAAGGSEDLCTGTTSLSSGLLCYLPVNFTPAHPGALSESLTITDNSLDLSGAEQSIALSGTGITSPALLTLPAPGSTLPGGPVTFSWTPGNGATGYALWVGSTGPGSDNLYYSGEKASTVTSLTVSGLPVNGETIYVRLVTYYSSSSTFNSYTYTAATGAVLTTPTPGSSLASPSVTFSWTAGVNATGYALWIGSTPTDADNLYYSGEKASAVTSLNVSGLPVNGETIYVRLITYYGSGSLFINYTYTAATGGMLTTPTPGSPLSGPSVTFRWTAGAGATGYALWIGSTPTDADNLFYSGEKASTVTSLTVSGLPANGETIYVRLITYYSGSSAFINYTYTAATAAVLTTPAPGGTLAGPSVTFSWTPAANATGYALWAGTTGTGSGSDNLYYSGEKASTVTSMTVGGLPANGETIYMRLITYFGAASTFTTYTYTAATGAVLTTPTPSSTLAGSSVTFSWTSAANATGYALWVGSTPTDADNLYYSGEKASTVTSLTVNTLPTNGQTIYVRLITYYGSSSALINYTYTAYSTP